MARTRRQAPSTRRELLAAETGARPYREAPIRVALTYPSPYSVAMSSLGYQTMLRVFNAIPDVCCARVIRPASERATISDLSAFESGRPLADHDVIAFSVAYELEIAGVVRCLSEAGLPPLRRDRDDAAPIVIAGGPLTFSNPVPLAPFIDVVVLGEGEDLAADVIAQWRDSADRSTLLSTLARRPGYYVPSVHADDLPEIARAADHHLPARSTILTPHTELRSMFLTEAARGCSRGCAYCVMRRTTNGGMRVIPRSVIVDGVPAHARRVGLVGAAVTDHPDIAGVVADIIASEREVGISSLRADRLTDELVALLKQGGYRTLTVASDGASEAMRRQIERSTDTDDLVHAAELARKHRLARIKIYMMLGLPGEADADVDELVRFSLELSRVHPRVSLGLAPFVAKRHTPLDGAPFAGIDVIDRRLRRLRQGLRGRVTVRPTSARWAWVEYMLAQCGSDAGEAVLQAVRDGGSFAAYKRAFADKQCVPTGPIRRVLSGREQIEAHKTRLRQLRLRR